MEPTPNVTLRYFPLTGRVQALRYALADAGVPYQDVRTPLSEWGDRRADEAFAGPYAALPTLSWNGATVSETLAVASFLSKKLGHYTGVADDAIAAREAVSSCAYLEVIARIGELLWADMLYPGADPARALVALAPRILGKLGGVEREARRHAEWFGGARPDLADFFAATALDAAEEALGPARAPALRARLGRLFERRDALLARPAIEAARRTRPRAFTARPDEPAVLARFHAAELSAVGL